MYHIADYSLPQKIFGTPLMPTHDSLLRDLSTCVIFKGVDENKIREFSLVVKAQSFAAGTILFDEKDSSDKVYLIRAGKIQISRMTNFGEETIIYVIGPGNLVGELSALDELPRSACATCIDDCELLVMEKKDFQRILQSDHKVSLNLMREISHRLREANRSIVQKLETQHHAIQNQFVRMRNLIEASKIINSTLDLDKLLGLILNAAADGIGADRGTLYLVDEMKGELWSRVLQGKDMVEIRLPMGKGIAGSVAQTGETVTILDAYNDPRFNPEIDKKTGYKTHSMLCMPMRTKEEKIIGVFQLLNKKEGEFDKDDEIFIDALSAHASVAIENARLAQEMVQNERLSAVGRMASTIIHDIKNPMGTLRVYAQVLKKKSGNEESAKLADEMIRQVDRFVSMTQEILDFSRGVSSMNIEEVDFEELVESVLAFMEKDLEKHNLALIRETDFKGKVKLDRDKLMRVFYNIIGNARDAMPEGGSITVSTIQSDGFIKIEFVDTGTGMPEEVKRKIFEPFVTHGKKHGTGLGMAIVKKIVDDHKGKIEIESELGKGTTIRIMLPIN